MLNASSSHFDPKLRKQRLIKGPQEFRDIRSNRAKIRPGFPE
jgi:hypothetical protein